MDKYAIVTGASRGIGKYVSTQLAQENFNVVIIARNQKKLKKVHDEIISFGKKCLMITADITKNDDIEHIKTQIKSLKIDVLINNAGIGIFNKIQNISFEEWNSQINTNLTGAFLMTKLVADGMIENKIGKIVFVNSVAGIKAYPYSSAYVASKFGLRGLASSLREELREHNIKVISVHPGSVDTDFWENTKVEFPREDMLSSSNIASSIVAAITAPNNLVYEEIVLRRTAGDF